MSFFKRDRDTTFSDTFKAITEERTTSAKEKGRQIGLTGTPEDFRQAINAAIQDRDTKNALHETIDQSERGYYEKSKKWWASSDAAFKSTTAIYDTFFGYNDGARQALLEANRPENIQYLLSLPTKFFNSLYAVEVLLEVLEESPDPERDILKVIKGLEPEHKQKVLDRTLATHLARVGFTKARPVAKNKTHAKMDGALALSMNLRRSPLRNKAMAAALLKAEANVPPYADGIPETLKVFLQEARAYKKPAPTDAQPPAP